jgi:MFS family permease
VGFAIGLTLGGIVASRSFFWLFVGDGATTLAFAGLIWMGVPETRPAFVPRAAHEPRAHVLSEFFAPYRDPTFLAFLGLSFCFALIFMQNATTFAVDMVAHGVSKAVYGRVLALNGILIVLVQPVLGPILTRHNSSRILAAGAALVGLGFGLNALATTVMGYVASVLTWTMGEMGVLPVANALVADIAPAALRGRYQGAYGFSFGLAVCAAPALGMGVLERFGSAALWLGCLALGLVIACGHLALRGRLTRTRRAGMESTDSVRVGA